jgi:RNA polymerase sigma-70 factor (ECF subfamily)
MSVASHQIRGILSIDLREGGKGSHAASSPSTIRYGAAPRSTRVSMINRPAVLDEAMSVETHSDEVLFDAYRAGDRGAFHDLMRRYSNELIHFLTRYLSSRPAADDVFQETFLQVHLSAETFDSSRRFKPWLFTIAANKARDYHRKYSKRTVVSLSNSLSSEGDGRQFVDLLEADIPTPECPLIDSERSRLVKLAIEAMPTHLREILLLSYFQQMSYNQIAESLEIPLGTVKSRLHTAVAAFAKIWKSTRTDDLEPDHLAQKKQS